MKLTLILAGPYSTCVNTQQVWDEVCIKHHVDLDVMNLDDIHGQQIARQLNLKSFPALILDKKVIAVGHPGIRDAEKIIAGLT